MTKIKDNGVLRDMTATEQAEYDAMQVEYENRKLPKALEVLRERRNQLLAETDFYALGDVTMSNDMKTYRQALRDLPSGKDTVEKCENATWPTKPS
tara:strand:+ start:523 stop:810 length:288 start_codon:yes stop_codon:yes gene_type:complete